MIYVMNGLFQLYVEGSAGYMTLVTLALVGVLIAAWKAPNWVREIGIIGLVLGFLVCLLGLSQACKDIQLAGDISPTVFCGGMKVALIAPLYGVLVYVISLVISLAQKPRK